MKNIIVKGCTAGQQKHLHDDDNDDGDGDDGERMVGVTMTTAKKSDERGPKSLNYDLEILRRECHGDGYRKKKRVVLALRDSEAFDAGVLTDLFLVLQ